MKTSTDEGTRAGRCAATATGRVGIALELRSYEFATFYSDVTRGAFQMYSLRWIGGNEQPDIFGYAFLNANFLPRVPTAATTQDPKLDSLLG